MKEKIRQKIARSTVLFIICVLLCISGIGMSISELGAFSEVKMIKQVQMPSVNTFNAFFYEKYERPSPEVVPENALPIKDRTILPYNGLANYGGVYVINRSENKLSSGDIEKLLSAKTEFSLDKGSAEPQILIYHTHATETYNLRETDYYLKSDSCRTTDTALNTVHIGDIVAEALETAGYKTVHLTGLFDDPDYNSSYKNSKIAAAAALKEYPSIKIVLDIHRDTVVADNGTKYATYTEINGESTAQIMLFIGSQSAKYSHPNWKENLKLAVKLQKLLTDKYGTFARPVLLTRLVYNQSLSKGSMLVEIGSCGNTLHEAELAAGCFSETLIRLLDTM